MLAPQGIGLSGPRFEFLLNRQSDLQGHRGHQLDEQGTDRRINDFARN